jgi:hypothetical protein
MCLAVILGKFHQPKTKTFCLAQYTSKVTKSLSASLIQDTSGSKTLQQTMAQGGEEGSHLVLEGQCASGHHQEAVEVV